MYRDQMRSTHEQEDRIAYLEMKLREFGQFTPSGRIPFSAPFSQIQFSKPPRRTRFNNVLKSPTVSSALDQVVETKED